MLVHRSEARSSYSRIYLPLRTVAPAILGEAACAWWGWWVGSFRKVGEICVGQRIAFSVWMKYINEELWPVFCLLHVPQMTVLSWIVTFACPLIHAPLCFLAWWQKRLFPCACYEPAMSKTLVPSSQEIVVQKEVCMCVIYVCVLVSLCVNGLLGPVCISV